MAYNLALSVDRKKPRPMKSLLGTYAGNALWRKFMMEMSTEGIQNIEPVKSKHSGFGVASFIISILAGLLIFLVIVIAGIMQVSTPGGLDKQSIQTMLVGLSVIALLFFEIAAVVLGIVGLFQKERKKLFAILGTIFSSLTVISMIALIIVGVLMSRGGV